MRTLILTCLCFLAAGAGAAEPPFRFLEKPGPHAVGLRIVEQYDNSRSFGDGAWPLQTLVWYPADRGSGRPVAYGDYMALGATALSFGKPRRSVGFHAWFAQGMEHAEREPMRALRDATPESGRFPLVVYAASYDAPAWENADFCEYLASHGYVVVSGPGMGPSREPDRQKGAEQQARDIAFFIAYAHTLPHVDTARIAVVGFSWGGLASVIAAARDPRIDALVSLDGSARYWPGIVAKSADVRPAEMAIPWLSFEGQTDIEQQQSLETRFPVARGESVLNQWTHGELISVKMLGLTHAQFNSATQRNDRFFQYEFAGQQQADYDRHDGVVAYSWVARYSREFLDATLESDANARKFLDAAPAANGVPMHTLAIRSRKAQPLPPTLATFKAEVARRGFDQVATVREELAQANPPLVVDGDALSAWGSDLLADSRARDALAVMRLAAALAPSGATLMGLGEAYECAGDPDQAMEAYREALNRDPQNIIVTQRLEALSR